ncbi:GTPase HflX [Hyphobacterium sp. CCMP332]|nr:GTPase HflX [Hyphobacterium sp. CCMP332]
METLAIKDKKEEKAVLVSLIVRNETELQAEEYLEELAFLAKTAGISTYKKFTQKADLPHVSTYVGKGKLEEINEYIISNDIDTAIFDDELTPSQVRNLENKLKIKIYDRSLLILDIFMLRAKTAQAKTQVKLARYEYLMPRLTRMWTHLERQRGGTGTRGGAGEKEIETDRRIIRNQISLLKKKLEKIEQQGITQRKSRQNMVRVALVGYTNVGKSTLMRILSKENVFAEDKLFATVDSTVRKVVLDKVPFLLTDTVGFIRKLPTSLIESFKSTLDEVKEADILLHVVDISHPGFEEQMEVVDKTLQEIGAGDKKTILVFNKIDNYTYDPEDRPFDENTPVPLEELKESYLSKSHKEAIFISAAKKQNIKELREILADNVKERHYMIFPNYAGS